MIKLNIGGHKFCTTKQTLCTTTNENFFHKLLNGEIPSEKDQDDAYFIDRNGKYFEPILDFLRTGTLITKESIKLACVLEEANFYLIDLTPAFCGSIKDGLYFSQNDTLNEILFIERDRNRPYLFAITGNVRRNTNEMYDSEVNTFMRQVGEVKDGVICCGDLKIYQSKEDDSIRIWDPSFFEYDVKLYFTCPKEDSECSITPDMIKWKQYGEANGLFFCKPKSNISNTLTVQYGHLYREKSNCYIVEALCTKFFLVLSKGKSPGNGFMYLQDNQKLWLFGSPILGYKGWEYFTKGQG